jgi:hypothetical protein
MARKSPYEREGDPKLHLSFVCYADVLGYKQESARAIASGHGETFLKKLRDTLNAAYERVRNNAEGWLHDSKYAVKVFTDNIVVGCPIADVNESLGEPELSHVFEAVIELQAGLAMQGLFLRGGIAQGLHYMDDDIVFGDALLEAVKMDRSGGPPRLALAPTTVETVRRHLAFYGRPRWAPHLNDLLEDADGTIFLNYLNAAFVVFPDGGVIFDVIKQHRDSVRANLARFRGVPGIRSKYEWAARYHNFVCREFMNSHPVPTGEYEDDPYAAAAREAQRLEDYLIEETELSVSPQRMTLTPLART